MLIIPVVAAEPTPTIDEWIARLGSSQYADRVAASNALEELGPRAVAALQGAATSADPEVRRRAVDLLITIEKRLETARFLAPRKVHLVYKDTPVLEAVEDLARKTGFAIRIEGDRAPLAGRKITLNVGPTSFWEALAVFCQKAGLVETAAPVKKLAQVRTGTSIVIIGGGVGPRPTDAMKPADSDKPREIILTAGTPPDLPTQLAGSLRVRALPPGTPVPDVSKGPGEALLALEVTAEPALVWKDVIAVKVNRAIDDKDRSLVQRWLSYKTTPPPAANTGVVIINGQVINPAGAEPRGNPRLAPLVLQLPQPSATKLKELTGTITGLILSAPETLVTVDNILKAAGQTFKGARAGAVRISTVSQKDNEIHLRIEVDAPPRTLVDRPGPILPNVIINGQPVGGKERTLSAANFTLFDQAGKPLEAIRATANGRGAGNAQELELTYRLVPGQGPPARFVYTDRRSAVIEVPFALKNVALP